MDYAVCERLKRQLIGEYQGKTLAAVCGGRVIRTPAGECFGLEHRETVSFQTGDAAATVVRLLSEISLLNGVGERKRQVLKGQGYETIESLLAHPRFGENARVYVELIHRRDVASLLALMVRRPGFSHSHPLVFGTSSFCRRERFLFLDIETMGLSFEPITLIGIAAVEGEEVVVCQYLARAFAEEGSTLAALQRHLEACEAIVSFNGRSFDVPYIRARANSLGIACDLAKPHFDTYHLAKRAWGDRLMRHDLGSVERHVLGVERSDDLPSWAVPEYYDAYRKTGSIGPLLPIIEHNRQDIISVVRLFSALHQIWR